MQQQDEGTDLQNNPSAVSSENASDEIPTEVSESVVQEVCKSNDPVLERIATEDKLETDDLEKSNKEDTISDSLPTRSKASKHHSKKTSSKQKRDDVEIEERKILTEGRNSNGITEKEHAEDTSALTNEETEVVEDDTHEVAFPVCGETNGIIDPTEELELGEYTECVIDDEKSESSQDITEEEISVTASVSYEEVIKSPCTPLKETEKYSLSVSSSEVHQFKSNPTDNEIAECAFKPENSYVSGDSWGGNIRSISARRPVRKHPLAASDRSSVSCDRQGNVRFSSDGDHSDTDCSVDTTEGSIFTLKRKAFETDSMNSKKQKVNDSKNSTFFSVVSSPLRLLRNKLSDRIMEGQGVLNTESISTDNNDDDDEDEGIHEKIKKEDNDIKETSQYAVAEQVNNQNAPLYRSWCSIM